MPDRDLFANFARMRREMDQLFGDWFRLEGNLRDGYDGSQLGGRHPAFRPTD